MNREQAVKYLSFSGFSDEQIKAIEGAFTCDKCVYSTSEGCQYDDITETIPPPVEPKTGHWIPSHIPESILDECSECGFSCGAFTFNYCPNCGAKMDLDEVNNG
jgi:hypothetical protein